ncbi:MAG: hypothetical protein HC824_00015 [Synechococcales cyanobacterium RM1_1_8]|nr:hypothetical protein [Synechococcales cyanobacterium RM1_1_8]
MGLIGGPLSHPAHAERIVDVTPAVNAQNVLPSTSISGVFENDSQGTINPASLRIYLNNRDITAASTITRSFFSYRPEQALAQGDYEIRVDYETTQGDRRSVGWRFSVSPQALALVESVTHNATGRLSEGATFLATLKGTPGGQASFYLIQDGQTLRTLAAQEVSPGVYVASLSVASNSNVREGVVVGRLLRGGQTTYGIADGPATLQGSAIAIPPDANRTPSQIPPAGSPAGQTPNPANSSAGNPASPATPSPVPASGPIAPQITSPTQDSPITTSGFTLTGQTSPQARVRITVLADTPLLGNVFSLGSERLVNREVQADAQGKFEVRVPAPTILKRDTRYQVTLEAVLNGQTAAPVKLEFKQR